MSRIRGARKVANTAEKFILGMPQFATPAARTIVLDALKELEAGVSTSASSGENHQALDEMRKYGGVSTQLLWTYIHRKSPPPPIQDISPQTKKQRMSGVFPIGKAIAPRLPDHPIRSVRYLKSSVLLGLQNKQAVQKVHSIREPTEEERAGRLLKQARSGKAKRAAAVDNEDLSLGVHQWLWRIAAPQQPTKTTPPAHSAASKQVAGEMANVDGIHYGYRKQKHLLPKPDVLGALQELKEQRATADEAGLDVPTRLDYGHLNKRRQNSRMEKAGEERKWIKMVSKAREEGVLDAQKLAAAKAQDREAASTS